MPVGAPAPPARSPLASPERLTVAAGFLTLEEAARVAGHARWLEDRLFAVTGGWVAVENDPAAKALFSAQSLRHAWHASVWGDRFPRVAHLELDVLTVPASAAVADRLDDMAAAGAPGPDGTHRRVVLLAALLQDLVEAYRERVARAHPLADGPTVRWLGFVLADETAALEELQSLATDGQPGAWVATHGVRPGDWLGLASAAGA